MVNNSLSRLTDRQRNVLLLVCQGFRNPEITKHVGLSPRAVKICVSQLLLIYDVSNRTELVGMLALGHGLFFGRGGPFGRSRWTLRALIGRAYTVGAGAQEWI